MKRQLFILALLAAAGFKATAQTEQGNFLAGGNVQLNTAQHNTNITLAPTVGYFFVDNFAGGAILDLSYTKTGVSPSVGKTTAISIGPFIRYYVGTTNIRPFLQGDVEFSSTKYKAGTESTTSTGTTFFVGPGAAIFLNRNVALEGLAGYEHTAYAHQTGSGGFAFKLGFQVYLSRAQVKTVTNTVR